jgi:uncharacterized protein YndB with AHSA1/START domain
VLERTIAVAPERVWAAWTQPNRLLVFTSVMAEDFRPVAATNGAGDLGFTARIEIEPTPDGGTHYRAIVMHANEDACKQHADMGFTVGWGAALDQLLVLMTP